MSQPMDHLILCRKQPGHGGYALWWRPNQAGYCAELEGAGRYTREEAVRICSTLDGDAKPVPVVAARAIAHQVVDYSLMDQWRAGSEDWPPTVCPWCKGMGPAAWANDEARCQASLVCLEDPAHVLMTYSLTLPDEDQGFVRQALLSELQEVVPGMGIYTLSGPVGPDHREG